MTRLTKDIDNHRAISHKLHVQLSFINESCLEANKSLGEKSQTEDGHYTITLSTLELYTKSDWLFKNIFFQ